MAEIFQQKGIKTIGIVSKQHSGASTSKRPDGLKLQDFCEIVFIQIMIIKMSWNMFMVNASKQWSLLFMTVGVKKYLKPPTQPYAGMEILKERQ